MRIPTTLLVLTLIASLPVPAASAYTITLITSGPGSSALVTEAQDGELTVPKDIGRPKALPYLNTASVVAGASSAESVYTLTNAGFDIMLNHSRTGAARSAAKSEGSIYFTVDQSVAYVASGSYSVSDPDGRRTLFRAGITDRTAAPSVVFLSDQWSQTTPNESFTLGESGGDNNNESIGSLTGTLLPGREYQFHYAGWIDAYPHVLGSGATATGNISLHFTLVPEPGTALLMGIGLVAMSAYRRRSSARVA